MHRRRRTALLLSAALVAAAPLLAACGNDAHPGAAAVVGGERITIAQLENRVNQVREAQRDASSDEAQYEQITAKTGNLTRQTLHGMVLERVLDRAAEDAGVTVTRRDVQQYRASLEKELGGAEGLELNWLQRYNVAPEQLEESLRSDVEVQKLATTLGADLNTEQGSDTFWAALADASKKLNIDLNPRYGAWDVKEPGRVDAKTPWVREVTATGSESA
ncbi:hypothetical protein SGFS_050590 [Streptomyces graminofaciens]|uniref:Lipoprotein n=1 Tax=Streptomyces graminofaciens TaxID=68212 RepID=A0ABM7FC64_9ACTN|nr:SurA N-terminal domain-containing protein [Streptomyces graminofaciens]BBC33765.1 hypothetical protein SGFS_050590 [Streptomyces graminofaciens]